MVLLVSLEEPQTNKQCLLFLWFVHSPQTQRSSGSCGSLQEANRRTESSGFWGFSRCCSRPLSVSETNHCFLKEAVLFLWFVPRSQRFLGFLGFFEWAASWTAVRFLRVVPSGSWGSSRRCSSCFSKNPKNRSSFQKRTIVLLKQKKKKWAFRSEHPSSSDAIPRETKPKNHS